MRLGLIDEFHLLVHPVAIGAGLALFATLPRPMNLQLVRSIALPKGSVANVYRAQSR